MNYRNCAVVALLSLVAAPPASALDISFSGAFGGDADVQLFDFSLDAGATVTIVTYGYAGGTQVDGAAVEPGGFDPIVFVFAADGMLIDAMDDGNVADVPADPDTGEAFDVFLSTFLDAGDYTLALTQYSNFEAGFRLEDGFLETDEEFTALFGCAAGQFCDVTGDDRTDEWALDILDVSSASLGGTVDEPAHIPTPAAGALLLGAVAALGLAARRRRRAR